MYMELLSEECKYHMRRNIRIRNFGQTNLHKSKKNISKKASNIGVTVNVLKFQTLYSIPFLPNFAFIQLFLKINGNANSVDPDQTVPSGAV